MYCPVIDKSQDERSNGNGPKLSCFAASKKVQNNKHINRMAVNQIDDVMIQEQFMKNVKDIQVCRGAEMESGHFLVRIKMSSNFVVKQNITKRIQPPFNIQKLKEENTKMLYQKSMDKAEKNIEKGQTIDRKWKFWKRLLSREHRKL